MWDNLLGVVCLLPLLVVAKTFEHGEQLLRICRNGETDLRRIMHYASFFDMHYHLTIGMFGLAWGYGAGNHIMIFLSVFLLVGALGRFLSGTGEKLTDDWNGFLGFVLPLGTGMSSVILVVFDIIWNGHKGGGSFMIHAVAAVISLLVGFGLAYLVAWIIERIILAHATQYSKKYLEKARAIDLIIKEGGPDKGPKDEWEMRRDVQDYVMLSPSYAVATRRLKALRSILSNDSGEFVDTAICLLQERKRTEEREPSGNLA